jgi:hypothetical protein
MMLFEGLMLLFVIISTSVSYKKGQRYGIEKTIDYLERKGYLNEKYVKGN